MPKEESAAPVRRRFSHATRLRFVERLAAGEGASALALELGVRRQTLYKWREAIRRHGPGPRRRGRPPKAAPSRPADVKLADAARPVERAQAARIAELERLVGRQALELRFFQSALREIEASRRPSDGRGATASSPPSRR